MTTPYRENNKTVTVIEDYIPPTWDEIAGLLADIFWYQQKNHKEPTTFREKLRWKFLKLKFLSELPCLYVGPAISTLKKYEHLEMFWNYALLAEQQWNSYHIPFRPFTDSNKYDTLRAKYRQFLLLRETLEEAAEKESVFYILRKRKEND